MKEQKKFRIKVQARDECWIADCEGDPGRTLVKEHAKTYRTFWCAELARRKFQEIHPNRKFWIEVETIQLLKTTNHDP